MNHRITCKRKVLFGFFLTFIAINALLILGFWNFLYSSLVIVWAMMMFYCLNKITERIALFCFGIAFFTFLIGRDGMEPFVTEEIEVSSANINQHTYIALLLGIIGVWFSFYIFSFKDKQRKNTRTLNLKDKIWYSYVRKYSIIAFCIVYPFAILVNLAIGYYVLKYGYAASFTDMRAIIENTPLYYTVSKIELLLPASFSIFIATLPSKEQFIKITKPYLIYLIITLGTGGRGDFILGLLLIIISMVFMQKVEPNIVWINKHKAKILLIIGIPVIAIGGSVMNIVRFGESAKDVSFADSFISFFYDQGVSVTTIKNAYKYEDNIPKQDDYYILEFLHTGILARILSYDVYQGNTIDHATKGGSFTHALGYTVMGDNYLYGRGTGSSYIAELYYDFGYIGIFLGSCLYGYIFSLLNNLNKTGLLSRSIIFIVLTKILWAPRGGYSLFLGFLLGPTTIMLIMFIFAAAQISFVKFLKTHNIKKIDLS